MPPTEPAEQALKHLILYLKGTEDYGVMLPYFRGFNTKKDELFGEVSDSRQDPCVEVFCDADWAASGNRRHSISAGMVFLQGCLVTSWSRIQKSIALSSRESEYLSLCTGGAEGLYLRRMWEFLTKTVTKFQLYTDSSSCMGFTNRSGVGRLNHLGAKKCVASEGSP